MAGAPLGNQNARKKPWAEALRRAVARSAKGKPKDGETRIEMGLNQIADQCVKAAIKGDWKAMTEIADRLDGKPMTQTHISADEGTFVPHEVRLTGVRSSDSD